MASKGIIVNPWHWLHEDGSFLDDSRIRNRSIRVAQYIEYGGPLNNWESRETLISCSRRPGGKPCRGLMLVLKQSDDAILAFCGLCTQDEFLIYEWEDTPWANGPQAPVSMSESRRLSNQPMPTPRTPGPENLVERLERGLAILGSSMDESEVRARLAQATNPAAVLQAVLGTLPAPPTLGAVERFVPLLIEVWDQTLRSDGGGLSFEEIDRRAAPHRQTSPKIGRNAPCPCGSGQKYKRCCGRPDRLH